MDIKPKIDPCPLTTAQWLIAELRNNPNFDDLASAELKAAIACYEKYGANFDSRDAFENENYHDIAEAIQNQIWGRDANQPK